MPELYTPWTRLERDKRRIYCPQGEIALVTAYFAEPEERRAIGDLIVASPDMYEACERALQFIKNGMEYGYISMPTKDDPAWEVPSILAKALSKAGGKQKTGD